MKYLKFAVLALIMLYIPAAVQAAGESVNAPHVRLTPAKPGPGDIVIVMVTGVEGPVEGKFGDRALHFNRLNGSFKAVLGIDLHTKPGKYDLDVSARDMVLSRKVKVVTKKYPVQRLTLPKDMVELSPENEARAEREIQKISAIWPNDTERAWDGGFVNPREGEITTKFGLRRFINGIPKNPHSGVDVAAEEGTEVYAPNHATVVMVDDHFFSGNSVVLDHGQGIYTMFFHLSKVLVSEGQKVKKGEVIALVGSTGRSTGAHLHWGVRMQGARVDPLALIKLELE